MCKGDAVETRGTDRDVERGETLPFPFGAPSQTPKRSAVDINADYYEQNYRLYKEKYEHGKSR